MAMVGCVTFDVKVVLVELRSVVAAAAGIGFAEALVAAIAKESEAVMEFNKLSIARAFIS